MWHPKGAIVRKLMEDYARARHERGGYSFVYTPHLANGKLFETSGHLAVVRRRDVPADGDGQRHVLHEADELPDALRDLPRAPAELSRACRCGLFELGTVYRYERAGTLHGLMRIRGFTQDDSHIYCTREQMPDEITSLLDFVISVLRAFGFDEFTFNLSTKDPKKYVGRDDLWEESTEALRTALDRHGLAYTEKKGDAAFYGPKIDIDVRDAIGRSWQLSTIQARLQPCPSGSTSSTWAPTTPATGRSCCTAPCSARSSDSSACSSSTTRVRSRRGWRRCRCECLPVATAHEEYAAYVADRLRAADARVDIVNADDQLGKRVRNAKLEKIPYVLVVGDDDVAHNTVGVNVRGGDQPERGCRDRRVPAAVHRRARGRRSRRPRSLRSGCSSVCGTVGVPRTCRVLPSGAGADG